MDPRDYLWLTARARAQDWQVEDVDVGELEMAERMGMQVQKMIHK